MKKRYKILPLLLLMVVLSLTACNRDNKKENDTPADAQTLISQAATSINTAESFRLELRQEGSPTVIQTDVLADALTFNHAEAFFVSPDRSRAKVSIAIGDFTQEVLLIMVQDRQYLNNALLTGGNWQQQTLASGFTPADLQSDEKGIGAALLAIENPSLVGNEEIDGIKVYHLSGTVPAEKVRSVTVGLMASAEGMVDIDVYIRQDDTHRIARIVLEETSVASDASTSWFISFDSYNQDFKIDEPTLE